jgi:hypothetical protein
MKRDRLGQINDTVSMRVRPAWATTYLLQQHLVHGDDRSTFSQPQTSVKTALPGNLHNWPGAFH